jgi:hypothetical protein
VERIEHYCGGAWTVTNLWLFGKTRHSQRSIDPRQTLVAPVLTAPEELVLAMEVAMAFDLDETMVRHPLQDSSVYVEDEAEQARSQGDLLIDVTHKLQEARSEATGLNDKLFLYFIDMAIFHACEVLANQSDLGEHEKWN